MNRNFKKGFTLIEIVVVTAILGILATLALFASMDIWRSYAFRSERNLIVSILQKSRMQSISNINQAVHGVRIDPNQYVIFEGNSYASRISSLDEVYPASSAISHSGMTEVTFDQLSGNAHVTGGNVTVQQGVNQSVISINNESQISWTN